MKVKISDIFDFEKGTLQSSKCTVGEYDFITASSDWKKHNTYSHECEALIIAVAASGSLGRTHYVSGKFIASDLCFILQPKAKFKEKINLKFYFEYFNFIKNDLIQKTATGSAKKAINKFNFAKYEIIFPDKKYQDKIVQRLSEFKNNFSRIEENLNYNTKLTTKLRQSILQDAIQGKLVPQDPTDEPASELLKKIKEEKIQTKNRIKDSLDEIKALFHVPSSWIWCKFSNIIKHMEYGTSEKSSEINIGIPVLRMNNIQKGILDYSNLKYVSPDIKDLPKLYLQKYDILFNRTNSYELVGKTALFEGNNNEYTFASYLIRVCLFKNYINPKYVTYYLNSQLFRKLQIEPLIIQQCGQANYSGDKLKNVLIPIPPKEEQARIVEKVDELMQLCDKLENENSNAQKFSSELLQSMMQKYFTPEV